ncbi:MAG: DUF2958 domain-containing protein [bacterium]
MDLLPADVERMLPRLYGQEHVADPTVFVKYFDPSGSFTWLATEGERQPNGDFLFFGRVDGSERDFGYFSIWQLGSVRGRFGLGIERDRFFHPTPLSAVR